MPSGWVGRELGPYFVFERIGSGSMAEVYKALQPNMDRLVGIKILSPQLSHDPQFVARFRREVQIAAALEHPHILPVIDFGQDDSTLYLVMRYVGGGTLHDLIQKGALPPQMALRYLTEIGEALDYAHSRKIVHRDIKPRNVLLDEQGNPFLTDFGLSKLLEAGSITSSGLEMIGTPHYMSPEQARGEPVDGRTDLYSLGVVLYQMLTGRVPFDADSTVGIIMKHIGAPVPSITAEMPDLPEALDPVIARAMAKGPDDRFQTAHELASAVAEALGTAVLAGRIVTRHPLRNGGSNVLRWWRQRTLEGVSFLRKVQVLLAWLLRNVRSHAAHGSLGEAVRRLFPSRREQTALVGGGLVLATLVVVAAVSLMGTMAWAMRPERTATPPPRLTATRAPITSATLETSQARATSAPAAATATAAITPVPEAPTATLTPPAPTNTPSLPADTALPPGTSTLLPGSSLTWDRDLMQLLYVPAGEFTLGAADSDLQASEDERPALQVYLDAFWIDQTEVTVAQFDEFVKAIDYQTDAERGCCAGDYEKVGGIVFAPNSMFAPKANWKLPNGPGADMASPRDPVMQVSWKDATAYCAWAGRRLPTEAEWEKAARGTDARLYPWGNEADPSRLNFCDRNCQADWRMPGDDGFSRTAHSGAYPAGASPYGALDMAGNVREWVADFYGEFRGYFAIPTANPPGPDTGDTRVLRGGSWLDSLDRARTTARASDVPDARNNVTGFRCAASPAQVSGAAP
jgi:formylglycine-generating enzyme required for sulfatase activity